jgi:hypothetical protein
MTNLLLFKNNAVQQLASGITSTSASLTLTPGAGASFPTPSAGQQFIATLIDAATGTLNEIIVVTAVSGDTFTILRGQEGTTALSWLAGDFLKMLVTQGTAQAMAQIVQAQASAFNSTIDTGTVNSYAAVLAPPITARVQGLVARVLAANSNTGPSTLNIGAGSIAISNPDGTALGAGAIVSGGAFEIYDSGSGPYQLISQNNQSISASGAMTTGDFKWRPTTETIAGFVLANGQTIGNTGSGATLLAAPTAANLFAWCWNNFPNTQCVLTNSSGVPVSRGANAAADFAALCRISVIDMRCISPLGNDNMGGAGTTNRLSGVPVISGGYSTVASTIGETLHSLVVGEIPSHTHNFSISSTTGTETAGHTHQYFSNGGATTSTGGGSFSCASPTSPQATAGESNIHAHNFATGGTTDGGTGGNGAHNNVALSMMGQVYLKL